MRIRASDKLLWDERSRDGEHIGVEFGRMVAPDSLSSSFLNFLAWVIVGYIGVLI